MRKLVSGLIGVALFLGAGQAGAVDNGTGDPLGLIGSGAVQPFWALGSNVAVLEITSPVGGNSVAPNSLEGIFFDANCVRDFSIPVPVTENDVFIFTANSRGVNYNGLFVLAASPNNFALTPVANPFHIRSQWVNVSADFIREIDPITIVAAESPVPQQTWNPLRSAASFVSPLEGPIFATEIFLNCPSPAVLGTVPPGNGFPAPPRIAFGVTKPSALIQGVIYDDNEFPLRNIIVPCGCSSMFPLLTLNTVYSDPASPLYYTELVTYAGAIPAVPPGPFTFTGYRAITVKAGVFPGGTGDDFGRLNNGSANRYQDIDFTRRGDR